MKRMLALILALAMCFSLAFALSSGAAAARSEHKTILKSCTRGGMAQLLYELAGSPDTSDMEMPFQDVPAELAPAVSWVAGHHYMNGVSDVLFNPDGTITRAMIAVFLWASCGQPEPKSDLPPYSDVEAGSWFTKAICWAAEEHCIDVGGDASRFRPHDSADHIIAEFDASPDGVQNLLVRTENGHRWGPGTTVSPATCTKPEVVESTCTICGYTGTGENGAPLGHDWGEWVVDTEPDCEGAGQKSRMCNRDHQHMDYEVIPPLGHDMGPWMVVEAATPEKDGLAVRHCLRGDSYAEYASYAYGELTPTAFRDVDPQSYYYNPVLWALSRSPAVTNGTGADTFSPDANCTRAQMVTFLWRAEGCPEPDEIEHSFTDLDESAYYYKAVLWAVEYEITKGTSETTFSPDATVSRAQTVTFLWRTRGEPFVLAGVPFDDVESDAYYSRAVIWAVQNQITNGVSERLFAPERPCTRAQIVTFLYRALGA